MSRNIFQSLLKFLHFASNDIVGAVPNRLQKLQPFLDLLLQKFKDVYTPDSLLVVDETMIPFSGCFLFQQYIPGKSHKYGCKLFKLCTPDAYTWNLSIYVIKSATFENLAASETVVVQLCQPLLGMGRTIFADNYYSSISLSEYLLKKETYYCGTLRANRKSTPKQVTQAKLKTGDVIHDRAQTELKFIIGRISAMY